MGPSEFDAVKKALHSNTISSVHNEKAALRSLHSIVAKMIGEWPTTILVSDRNLKIELSKLLRMTKPLGLK